MATKKKQNEFEYILKLFISGSSPNSIRAITNIQKILDEHIPEQYTLSIIDLHQDKAMAAQEQIVALPLLIKKFPLPERRLVGDMSNTAKVLEGLGVTTV